MNYTEQNNIPGLLLLTDFEKTFDSLSWSFVQKALNITKTRLFKYIENFTTKEGKFSDKNF